jgi:hypothetical protein
MVSPQKHEKGAGIYDAEQVYPKIAQTERPIGCQFRVWLQETAAAPVDQALQKWLPVPRVPAPRTHCANDG